MTFSRTGRWFFAGLALAVCLAGSVSATPEHQASFELNVKNLGEHRGNFETTLQGLNSHSTSPGALVAWARGVATQSLTYDTDLRNVAIDIENGGNDFKDTPTTPCGSVVLKLYGPYGRGVGYERLSGELNDELQSIRTAIAKLDERQNELNHALLGGKPFSPGFTNNEWSVAMRSALTSAQSAYQSLSRTAASAQARIATLNATLNGPKCQTGGKTSVSPSALPSRSPSPSPKPAVSPSPKLGPSPAPSPSGGCPSGYIRTTTGGCVPYRPWMN